MRGTWEADIDPMTWKAICRRGGCHQSGKKAGGVSYDWNTDFSEPFFEPLALPWSELYNNKLTLLLHAYVNILTSQLRAFSSSMETSITSIFGRNYRHAQAVFDKVPHLENQIREKVSNALNSSQEKAREINRTIKGLVVKNIIPVYDKCSVETGELG